MDRHVERGESEEGERGIKIAEHINTTPLQPTDLKAASGRWQRSAELRNMIAPLLKKHKDYR